ncbi:MAG: DUF1543 domain-containing protein [Candidatus Moranbacteria bacterium]|nr:DUF1543 domain-containing protein [Candidatus Moranbacteria bacterium]
MDSGNHLYAVLLGGISEGDDLMEAHRLEFVVASSEKDAKGLAKERFSVEKVHVDGIRRLETVDGYAVILEKIG